MVYKVDNEKFEEYGVVNQFTSLAWPESFVGYGTFTLNAPITEENNDLLQDGNIIWCGGDSAAIIDNVSKDCDEEGVLSYKVTGRTLEVLFERRVLANTLYADNDLVTSIMRGIVNDNCIASSDSKRNFSWLSVKESEPGTTRMTLQKTGDTVYKALEDIANSYGAGFYVRFDPRNKSMKFEAIQGVDRSVDQEIVDPVIITTDLEDILKSSYKFSSQDYRNVAYVDGEGEGSDRVRVISGNVDSSGFDRRELYVDARDVQSEYQDEDGTKHTLTQEQYKNALDQRGSEKLAEYINYESLEVTIRSDNKVQYEYGRDYFCGDTVTVVDNRIRCAINARVTAAEEDISDKYELVLTFGDAVPTIGVKLNKLLS